MTVCHGSKRIFFPVGFGRLASSTQKSSVAPRKMCSPRHIARDTLLRASTTRCLVVGARCWLSPSPHAADPRRTFRRGHQQSAITGPNRSRHRPDGFPLQARWRPARLGKVHRDSKHQKAVSLLGCPRLGPYMSTPLFRSSRPHLPPPSLSVLPLTRI
jgi:hypothetical protein